MHKVYLLSNNNTGDKMIKEMMSKQIISVKSTDSVKDAASKLLSFDIGFLPVVKDKMVIGVITDRDLATKVFQNATFLDVPVESYATKNVITCDVSATSSEALEIMKKNRIKRLIVTENKKVVGILSFSDILYHFADPQKLIDTLKEIYIINRNTDQYQTEIDEFYL